MNQALAPKSLTHDRLIHLLMYDETTGIFNWAYGRVGVRAGAVAGSLTRNGYIKIRIDKVAYYAHRLAVFYMTGVMPPPSVDVDHVDGVKTLNSYTNLRAVSHQINQQNRQRANRRVAGRSSRFLGVSWKKEKARWVANIGLPNGRLKHLGYFDDEDLAGAAYLNAKRNLHEGNTL